MAKRLAFSMFCVVLDQCGEAAREGPLAASERALSPVQTAILNECYFSVLFELRIFMQPHRSALIYLWEASFIVCRLQKRGVCRIKGRKRFILL